MNHPSDDQRLRQIYQLLQGLMQSPTQETSSSHWDLPVLPPPDPEGRLSSTDLLSWWFHAPRRACASDPWGEFFAAPQESSSGPPAPAVDSLRPAPSAPPEEIIESPPLLSIFPEPEEHLAEEHAQAAIDLLYDWLHAVGRRDVDAAMACISEEYHAMEDDREVDRLSLRHHLESHLDALRDWNVETSLAEAPEPLAHPYGVLIAAEIQLDAHHPQTGAKSCQVESRIALLRQETDGEWKIAALSLVER